MNTQERRDYHKRWRQSTNREQFLEGQRRRRREWYQRNLKKNREVARLKAKRWRDANRQQVRKRNYERWLKASRRNRRFVDAYKNAMGCVDCGERDPIVLDFDHRRGQKRLRVSSMRAQGWPLVTIVEEIKKCEVRCANCHRRRHATP